MGRSFFARPLLEAIDGSDRKILPSNILGEGNDLTARFSLPYLLAPQSY
jgi:hypothetical protein